MSSFLQAELPSDDEADEDFNPTLPKEDTDSTEKKNIDKRLPKGESSHTKAARKARVDALWEQLLAKCAPPKRAKGGTVPQEKTSKPAATNNEASGEPNGNAAAAQSLDAADHQEQRRHLAATALAAAKAAAAASASWQYGMPQVTEVRRFAGQDVVVKRAAKPSETKAGAATPDEGLGKPKGGMDAVLATLAGPKKVNVLDKTRSDWTDFKSADTDIDAELEAHKRSAAQYLEKQAFLQQADVKQYESERDQRLRGR